MLFVDQKAFKEEISQAVEEAPQGFLPLQSSGFDAEVKLLSMKHDVALDPRFLVLLKDLIRAGKKDKARSFVATLPDKDVRPVFRVPLGLAIVLVALCGGSLILMEAYKWLT